MNKVVSSDGTPIAFDRAGTGSPVILVGGAFQQRADPMFEPLAVLLSSRFTVVNYDRRGRGDSGDTPPYAVAREVEDLAALMNEVGGSASLFGMSSGGVLALEAAASGLLVTKLALYEPPFIVDASRPPVPDDYLARLMAAISAGHNGDAVALFMTEAVGMPAETVAGMRNAPFWPSMEVIAPTLIYDGTLMREVSSGHPLPARWSSIDQPTLVIDGGDSPAYEHAAVDALARLLPMAGRQTLAGQTHQVDPSCLAPVVEKFFLGV